MIARLLALAEAIERYTSAGWFYWLALFALVAMTGSPYGAALALGILLFAIFGSAIA